jgi:quinol monooxygenase YgiN
VLVVTRFRVSEAEQGAFQVDVREALAAFAARTGFLGASLGRAADDPSLWVLVTTWQNVGAYRRALSSYDVKICVVPLQRLAIDEPSAYEIILGTGAHTPNEAKPRGDR